MDTYSISQICEILKTENFNLRYIEKTTGIEIKRNEFGERTYTEQDLNKLKLIFQLKEQGLNYKAIKSVLEKQEEIVETKPDESSLLIPGNKMEQFINMLKNSIDESIENKVNSKFEGITNKLGALEKQNNDLKGALEKEQERHFKELDTKLIKWREEQEAEKNKPWFKKLLGK